MRQGKWNTVLALRNKLCRTGANISLFRTWAARTLCFFLKDLQPFLFVCGAGAQAEWWYHTTQKLGRVFWLPLKVRMMWNQNCDRQCEMFDRIQTKHNVTMTSDIPSGVICLCSDIIALKNLLKSILFLFHVLHINLWLKIHDHCWVQRPLSGDTLSTQVFPFAVLFKCISTKKKSKHCIHKSLLRWHCDTCLKYEGGNWRTAFFFFWILICFQKS